jgi:hypothetical protein
MPQGSCVSVQLAEACASARSCLGRVCSEAGNAHQPCCLHPCCPAGILGPVVLEAAVGAQYAPLGMLATIVLYFQQLPLAQLLFQFHKQQQDPTSYAADSTGAVPLRTVPGPTPGVTPGHKQNGHSKVATSPEPCGASQEQHMQQDFRGSHGNLGLAHAGVVRHLHHTPTDGQVFSRLQPGSISSSSSQPELQQLAGVRADGRLQVDGSATAVNSQGRRQHGHRLSWDLEQQQQGLHTSAAGTTECDALLSAGVLTQRQQPQRQGLAIYALSLLLKVRAVPGVMQLQHSTVPMHHNMCVLVRQ